MPNESARVARKKKEGKKKKKRKRRVVDRRTMVRGSACATCGVRAFGQHECPFCFTRFPQIELVVLHQKYRRHIGGHLTQQEYDDDVKNNQTTFESMKFFTSSSSSS